ncbi:hypothetical protein, partial [Burkholderia pyrrocinia]|uniref:hypothetical protein n=1 Tax=Burkholderia pyrrocinia TaxID=60550 RepID=UPI004055F44E
MTKTGQRRTLSDAPQFFNRAGNDAPCRAGLEEREMTDVVIVSAARTAVGKFGGSLAKIAAPELGAT